MWAVICHVFDTNKLTFISAHCKYIQYIDSSSFICQLRTENTKMLYVLFAIMFALNSAINANKYGCNKFIFAVCHPSDDNEPIKKIPIKLNVQFVPVFFSFFIFVEFLNTSIFSNIHRCMHNCIHADTSRLITRSIEQIPSI